MTPIKVVIVLVFVDPDILSVGVQFEAKEEVTTEVETVEDAGKDEEKLYWEA